MNIKEYNYPLIVFKEDDKNIYAILNDFGIISKGGDKFYNNLTVIDSKGNVYVLKKSMIKHVAPFLKCLKYFQKMWEMELDFDEVKKITINELKEKIVAHVFKYPKHWLSLDTVDGIIERINKAESFNQIATIFK